MKLSASRNVTGHLLPFCLLAASAPASAQIANSIDLSASRDSLRADGYSRAVITAEVRDRSGRLVPDGTEVRFSTTLGAIDPVATTEAGRARVNFTSAASSEAVTATITVSSGQAYRSLSVLLLTQGETQPARPSVITLAGDYVAYSADHATLEAIGHVTARLGRITLLAGHVQINVATNRLLADSQVDSPGMTVTDGKTTWIATHLIYEWPVAQGVVDMVKGVYRFAGPPLIRGVAVDRPSPADFQMVDLEDTTMWITARRVSLFPGHRIHFQKAQVRPDGKKLLSLPYHSLPLVGYGPESEQFVGLGTQGVTLDLPYYLNAGEHSATSLRLGWNQISGSFGAVKPGFSLDLRHRAFVGETGEETVNLSRFTSSDWGAWYRHQRAWSPTVQTSAFIDFPAHRDLFAAGSAYWQGPHLTAALSATSSKPRGVGASYLADVSLETIAVRLARTGWKYSFISSTGLTTGAARKEIRQALYARLTLPSWNLGHRTHSTATLTGGQIVAGSRTGFSADAYWSVNHQFGRTTALSVNYSYFQRPGLSMFTSRHRVSSTFVSSVRRASFATLASRTLDGRSTSMINDLTYDIAPRLRMGARNTWIEYAHVPFSDQEFSITFPLLQRPFTVFWSKRRHRLMLELSQSTF